MIKMFASFFCIYADNMSSGLQKRCADVCAHTCETFIKEYLHTDVGWDSMGDASNSRASKGNGILGGLLRRVTGGRNETKEETARTGVSLKDRFSALKGAAPTEPVPHQQRTLDDIRSPDETDVKVIHTSAARSMRFSDRVGVEPCTEPLERRISFDENDDDRECGDASKDREKTPVGKYATNKITFEDDVPCTPEKKDGIGSRYGSEKHVADAPADVADERTVTEGPAVRMTLAERLKAHKAKCPDAGAEQHTERSDAVTEIVADSCKKEPENNVAAPVSDIAENTADAEIMTDDKTVAVPDDEYTHTDAEEEHAEVPAAAEEDTIPVMPIQMIEITNPEPEAAPILEAEEVVVTHAPIRMIEITDREQEVMPLPEAATVSEVPEEVIAVPAPEPEEIVVTHSQPMQIIEIMNPEPEAAPVSEVPEMCIMIPDRIFEEARAEHAEEVTECIALPFTEYLALMPASVEPMLIDDVCSRELCEPAPAVECIIPVVNTVNEAILEIENDVSLPEYHDGDTDDIELDILRLLCGVIVDNEIIPAATVRAEPPVTEAPIAEPIVTEDTVFIPFAAFEAIAPEEVHIENETFDDDTEEPEEDNGICFSFLSEWSTTPNAEVRFVWG